MIDFVFPNNNEKEFTQMAERLGIGQLVFIYKNKKDFQNGANALLVEPKNVRKDILTICQASREAIERGANIVYGFELQETKEKTHHRSSGLNQVLCKLATRKKVRIGFSFSTILNSTGQKRAILLGRMMQNIRFCTKYKTPMKIASGTVTA